MKKRIIIISVVVVSVALIGLAFAAGPGGGWNRTPEEKVDYLKTRIASKLELDDSQKATLDRIADELMAERQAHSEERQAFKESFVEMLAKDEVRPEELKALFDTKKPAIEGVMRLASEYLAEFHSILTPDQRATLVAEIESHKGRRCGFMR